MKNILIAMLTMGGMGFLFAYILSIAKNKLKVEIDPRIERIESVLPGTNCGCCGYPGCRAFAEAVVSGQAKTNCCSVGGDSVSGEIAKIVGVKIDKTERYVAVLMCRGTESSTKRKAKYCGIKTCYAASLIQGGDKYCSFGCLGFGDCMEACPFNAIKIGADKIPVIDRDICTGCGLCVKACPKNLIELHPISRKLYVYCKSHDDAKTSIFNCKNACIACGLCTKGAKNGEITVIDNLSTINNVDIEKNEEAMKWVQKCPTKSIDFIK